jgi:Autophagy protein ATG9
VFHFLYAIVFAIFISFWLYQLVDALLQARSLFHMRDFYVRVLGLRSHQLGELTWPQVTARILRVERLCLAKPDWNALDLCMRLTRRENYLVAMTTRLPWLHTRLFTKPFEWLFEWCVFGFVFDRSHSVAPSVLRCGHEPLVLRTVAAQLRRRMRVMGIVTLLLSPFVLAYLGVFYLFQYGEQMRSTPSWLGARTWSPFARWRFREFNEVDYELTRRLNLARKPATRYLNRFSSPLVGVVARFLTFVFGSVVVMLLVLGLANEEFLESELLPGRSAVWWLGVLAVCTGICRSLVPTETSHVDPEQCLVEVAKYTHYLPPAWKQDPLAQASVRDFSFFFEFRLVRVVCEFGALILAPLWLIVYGPRHSEELLIFFSRFTTQLDGVGSVCSFSTFNLDVGLGDSDSDSDVSLREHDQKHATGAASATEHDDNDGDDVSRSPSDFHSVSMEPESLRRAATSPMASPLRYEIEDEGIAKMQASLLLFKQQHGEWTPPPGGQRYLDSVQEIMAESGEPDRRVFGLDLSIQQIQELYSLRHSGNGGAGQALRSSRIPRNTPPSRYL